MFRLTRSVSAVVVIFASVLLLGTIPPSRAQAGFSRDSFAAIAYSEQTGRYGYANRFACLVDAQRQAISNCCAADAHVVVAVENGWVALAQSDGGRYGCAWSTRSLLDAERCAVQNCGPFCSNPHVVLWVSSW